MMRTRRSALAALLRWSAIAIFLLIGAAALAPSSAEAADLDDAKRQGWVGERPDGYVGLVRGGAPADIQALVTRINGDRRNGYEKVAQRTGASVREVAILAGRRLIGSAPPGTYILTATGEWIRK